jgi:hypothetical protein
MPDWEAEMVQTLRLWCDGPEGQSRVCARYRAALPPVRAQTAIGTFETLMIALANHAHRALVRHSVGCNCVGADECIVLHLIRTASNGALGDAALISSLLVGAPHAERTAIFAGQVGTDFRALTRGGAVLRQDHAPSRGHTLH